MKFPNGLGLLSLETPKFHLIVHHVFIWTYNEASAFACPMTFQPCLNNTPMCPA